MNQIDSEQIPDTEGKNISVRISSQEKQKLSKEIKSKILKAFFKEYKTWNGQQQENLAGTYKLTVCEKVEIGKRDEHIAIPIEHENTDGECNDGGYLEVFGLRETEN